MIRNTSKKEKCKKQIKMKLMQLYKQGNDMEIIIQEILAKRKGYQKIKKKKHNL